MLTVLFRYFKESAKSLAVVELAKDEIMVLVLELGKTKYKLVLDPVSLAPTGLSKKHVQLKQKMQAYTT